jgi:ankyrin repeat protein
MRQYKAVKLLLNSPKIIVDCRDKDGYTPFLRTAENTAIKGINDLDVAISQTLLSTNQVDINTETGEGIRALAYAISNSCQSLDTIFLKSLMKYEELDISYLRTKGSLVESTPFMKAITSGSLDAVQIMMTRRDLALLPKSPGGWSLLMSAAYCCDAKVIDLLLQTGYMDVNYKTSEGHSALHVKFHGVKIELAGTRASGLFSTRALELPLSAGADPDSRDSNGCTPLMLAARNGCHEAVKLLLETREVLVDRHNLTGWSALSIAALE